MENINTFTDTDMTQIFEFVRQYDDFNESVKGLEEKIKALLDEQEDILKSLNEVRKIEEEFFKAMSEKTGLDVLQLKRMAQSLIMNLTND